MSVKCKANVYHGTCAANTTSNKCRNSATLKSGFCKMHDPDLRRIRWDKKWQAQEKMREAAERERKKNECPCCKGTGQKKEKP